MVSGRLTFGRRVKLWPIMMMVVVIAAGIIALNSLVKAKDELHLSCEARFYKPFLTGDVPEKFLSMCSVKIKKWLSGITILSVITLREALSL